MTKLVISIANTPYLIRGFWSQSATFSSDSINNFSMVFLWKEIIKWVKERENSVANKNKLKPD